tara:strand:+ start:93 stop:992 length:900 start_codon:yes stop_codon:yes gene_type:complete
MNKSKIDVKNIIPKQLIPRSGKLKKINFKKLNGNYSLTSPRCQEVVLPTEIYLESADYVAIGLYLAEGTKYFNLTNIIKHCGEIAYVNSYPECINPIINLLNKFNIKSSDLKWKIGLNINFKSNINSNTLIKYWIKNTNIELRNSRPQTIYYSGKVGGKISNNTNKYGCLHIYYASTILRGVFLNFINVIFNHCINAKSKDKIALILKGHFAGDGSVNYSKKYNRKQVEFICNNFQLINKLKKSLKILGLTSIKETWPNRTKTHSKSLRIYNNHDFKILKKYDILSLLEYKRKTFSKIL